MHQRSIDTELASPPARIGLSADTLADADSAVQALIDAEQLAGAVVIVARRGRVGHFRAYGRLSVDTGAPMPEDAIFRIASMTKPVGSVAAMMLYDEGRLDLDAPASEYLPELADMQVVASAEAAVAAEADADPGADQLALVAAERPITVRDLLRHTSGLPGAARYLAGNTAVDRRYRQLGMHLLEEHTLEEAMAIVGRIPLLYQPGSRWHYSVSADVVGRLVEVVSGQAFDAFLADRIFRPLGMTDTGFFVPAAKRDRFAALHGPSDGPSERGGLRTMALPRPPAAPDPGHDFERRPRFLSNGGGLVSTASDYMRFCLMLTGGGTLGEKRILTPEAVALMTRNHLPEELIPLDKQPEERYDGLGFGLGVSVRVHRTDWIPAAQVGEYGWIGGASTEFWIAPQAELAVVALAQHIPFSRLTEVVKPIVYAALQ